MKKELREGYKITELGEIPNEWKIKKLSDVSEIIMGQSPNSNSYNNDGIGIAFFQGKTEFGRINPIVKKWCSNPTKISKPLDILISVRAPVGAVNINNIEACIGRGLGAIRQNEFSNYRYLYYAIQQFQAFLLKSAQGSTFEAINSNDLKSLKIPIPSLCEQEKIAEILSVVDEQIENTEKLIQKNQELKKGLMQQLLTKGIGHTEFKKTEIGSVPIEWEIKNLEYLVEIRNGNSPSNFTLNETGKYPFFKVDDMNYTNKYLNKAKVYFDDCKYSLMIKGMIVFPKRGASIFTNKIAILNLNGYFDTNIMGLKCKDELINEYLFYYLKFIGLERFADTTAVPQINNKHINPLKIPIPSIIEQEKIVWGLDQIDGKIEQYKNKKEKLEYLKGGLMQDLLLGKIRVI
ncbi:TPA: restriction endonuclease subunit S [Clostridium perfringens]|nr:restriction endonuclease subunit S [Clostridium perfringens]